MARYEHTGNAAATTLSSAITSSSTTINITSATGWPTGAVGAFWVTIDAGTASEEKVLVTSRTGTALTVSSRGADSTTATSHANGAAIIHSFSATEADAANAHVEASTGHGATGAVVGTTNTQTLTNKTLTSPVLTTPTGVARGTLGYAQVVADQTLITTEVDLTGLSIAVTVGTSRRIRVTADLFTTSTVATDHVAAHIKEGATYLTQRQVSITRANSGEPLHLSVILTPTAGAHTYKVAMLRAAGSGNVSSLAAATYPAYILVEDLGDA